jgi:agmatinase
MTGPNPDGSRHASVEPGIGDQAFLRESPYGTVAEPTYGGALSFMRRRYTRDLAGVDVAVLGVPYDLAVSNRPGARFGPRAIRAASTQIAWERLWPWDFDAMDRLHVVDAGDCPFDPGYPQGVAQEISAGFGRIMEQGVATLALGGDHFVSYPILQACARQFGPLALVHFDAHSDTWAEDEERIDHGSMFYHAARIGIVDPARSVQIGIRTFNEQNHGFTVLDARFVHERGVAAVVETVRRVVGDHPCYISFDIDVLDPCFAPGTGTPVVGGLSTHQARMVLHGLAGLNLKGMDVVEVAPAYDSAEITALAGATIAADMLYAFASQRRFAGKK